MRLTIKINLYILFLLSFTSIVYAQTSSLSKTLNEKSVYFSISGDSVFYKDTLINKWVLQSSNGRKLFYQKSGMFYGVSLKDSLAGYLSNIKSNLFTDSCMINTFMNKLIEAKVIQEPLHTSEIEFKIKLLKDSVLLVENIYKDSAYFKEIEFSIHHKEIEIAKQTVISTDFDNLKEINDDFKKIQVFWYKDKIFIKGCIVTEKVFPQYSYNELHSVYVRFHIWP